MLRILGRYVNRGVNVKKYIVSWLSFANKHLALVFTIIMVGIMVIICFGIFFHAEHWENVRGDNTFYVQTDMSNEEYKSDIQIKDEKNILSFLVLL